MAAWHRRWRDRRARGRTDGGCTVDFIRVVPTVIVAIAPPGRENAFLIRTRELVMLALDTCAVSFIRTIRTVGLVVTSPIRRNALHLITAARDLISLTRIRRCGATVTFVRTIMTVVFVVATPFKCYATTVVAGELIRFACRV